MMTIQPFQHIAPISLQLLEYDLGKTDTDITPYRQFRLCVILTDGISAVCHNRVYRVCRGDILFFRPDEVHFGRVQREGKHRFLDIYIPLSFFDSLTELMPVFSDRSPKRINCIRPWDADRTWVLGAVDKLLRGVNGFSAFSLVMDMVNLCNNMYSQPQADDTPATVTAALRYIDGHFSQPVALQDVASAAGCSITYLTRSFRKATGVSVLTYLTHCRIAHAKKMLDSGKNVTEACFLSGFGDCSYFIRVFRKAEGLTPSAYQKRRFD